MQRVSEDQVEKLYALLLERLEPLERAQVLQTVATHEQELANVCTKYDVLQDSDEKELQQAVTNYERVQRSLARMEERQTEAGGLDDESEIEATRIQNSDALEVMEACLSKRTQRSVEYAEAKSSVAQARLAAIRAALEQYGGEALQRPPSNTSEEVAHGPPPASASESGRYEPLQPHHADIIIRVPGGFKKIGIEVDATGTITKAPGGLFDSDYRLLSVDGQAFSPGLQDVDGAHSVILRCAKIALLQSLHRLPPRQIQGKSLKLLQVQLRPDANGFGIDLSEFNSVVGIAKGGAAETSDLRVSDIIIAADGVNTGDRRLVEVLQRGRKTHIFSVIRPSTMSAADKPDLSKVAASGLAPSAGATAGNGSGMPMAAMQQDDAETDALKRSLAASLGSLQTQNEMLSAAVVHFVRISPTDGSAITVEWAMSMGSAASARFHLEWKLEGEQTWSSSEASRNLKSTVVTKGNLQPDGAYQFRVRARHADSDEWGAWSEESITVRPDALPADQLPTITEESEVSAVTPSVASTRTAGMGGHAVQALMQDQRQALTNEHQQHIAALEAKHAALMDALQEELSDWKAQFAEVAGNSLQAVLEAKSKTREEVLAELAVERDALNALKAETDEAQQRIQAAETLAAEAKAEAEQYKARFDTAFDEAVEHCNKEAEAKLNVIMRNASLEMRDKLKFVEDQTEATVKRAVDEAVRLAEEKAEAAKRAAVRELMDAHEKEKEMMRAVVGASAQHRIQEVQEDQESRVAYAVREALAEASEVAKKREAAAIQSAVASAIEKTKEVYAARQAVLEQQLLTTSKETASRVKSMYTEEEVRVRLAKAREEALVEKNAAVEEAVALEKRKASVYMGKMSEGLSEKVQEAVRTREKQLLAEDGRGLKELAETDLKAQSTLMQNAGRDAAKKWGSGNDDFEENALMKTMPVTLFGPDELLSAIPKPKPPQKSSGTLADLPSSQTTSRRDADEESMVAPSIELVRLRARHAAEVEALVTRQEADELMEPENDDEAIAAAHRREARAKRAAEKEDLRQRQVAEAMAAGAALLNEERAKLAMDDQFHAKVPGASNDIADVLHTPIDPEISELTTSNPAMQSAVDKVLAMERELQKLTSSPGGESVSAEHERVEHRRAAEEMQDILSKRQNHKAGKAPGINDEERRCLEDAMTLLHQHHKRGQDMQAMLHDIMPTAAQGAPANETASNVQNSLSEEEKSNNLLAEQVQALLAREAKGALTDDELVLIRSLVAHLKQQQQQAETREAQINWLKAETKRARVTELIEARAQLEQVHAQCVKNARLQLPFTPVAAVEDASSIALDWAAPGSGEAIRYHLQWRVKGDTRWTSSKASEQIKVPCCMKGGLQTDVLHEFRVRAADKDGVWGPWSKATELLSPSAKSGNLPSRPSVSVATKRCANVEWKPPEHSSKKVAKYEVQWRRCDAEWGEENSLLESEETSVSIPALQPGKYYTFRVRAFVKRSRGDEWTNFGPTSAPTLIPPTKSKGKTLAEVGEAAFPLRSVTAEDGETVIAEQIRQVARVTTHPAVQAAADATVKQATLKKSEDASNLQTLEERHKKLVTQEREQQWNDIVALKQVQLKQAAAMPAVKHDAGEGARTSEPSSAHGDVAGKDAARAFSYADSWD